MEQGLQGLGTDQSSLSLLVLRSVMGREILQRNTPNTQVLSALL